MQSIQKGSRALHQNRVGPPWPPGTGKGLEIRRVKWEKQILINLVMPVTVHTDVAGNNHFSRCT